MDTRRSPDTRERGSTPELGTETVPVELVELTNVSPSGGGFGQKAFLAVGAIGLVALVVLIANGKPTSTTPSPSAPAVALASPSPASRSTPATTRVPPTAAPPTSRPTPPPPWQWTRSDLSAGLDQRVRGMWGVNDQILVLVSQPQVDSTEDRSVWSIARLGESGARDEFAAPPAIEDFTGASVIDDRLWFLAHIGGVSDGDATWQLVSTADGVTWDSKGVVEGLAPFDGTSFSGRAGDVLVIATWRDDGNGNSIPALSWSTDGRQWKRGSVPELPGQVGLIQAASIGRTMVILGLSYTSQVDVTYFILASDDGRTWHRSTFDVPSTGFPRELACDDNECLVTLQPLDDATPSQTQVVMRSTDGQHWTAVTIDVPAAGPDSWLTRLRATKTGFVAMGGAPSPVLLSDDGTTWRSVDVLPPDSQDYFSDFAVAKDVVAGLVDVGSDIPEAVWVGSLAAMGS